MARTMLLGMGTQRKGLWVDSVSTALLPHNGLSSKSSLENMTRHGIVHQEKTHDWQMYEFLEAVHTYAIKKEFVTGS